MIFFFPFIEINSDLKPKALVLSVQWVLHTLCSAEVFASDYVLPLQIPSILQNSYCQNNSDSPVAIR